MESTHLRNWLKSVRDPANLGLACRVYSHIFCAFAALFPVFAAVGWIFDTSLLKQVHPSLPVMQPNTILILILGALAALSTNHRPKAIFSKFACLMGLILFLFGFLTLCEYLFGWNLGFDNILFDVTRTESQVYPGRASTQAALNFTLLGIAILGFNLKERLIPFWQGAIIALGANSVAVLTGYIFDTDQHHYGFPHSISGIGMAVHTALSFIFLGLGLLFRRPTEGMMSLITGDTRAAMMARRLLLTGLVAPPLIGLIAQIGVAIDFYDIGFQASLFAIALVGIILHVTWRAARLSEKEELRARVAHDELKRVNNELKLINEQRQIFASVIEASSDFIGIADNYLRPTYLNQAGRNMLGLSHDAPIKDIKIEDCYAPDQRQFAKDVILKKTIEEGYWKGETSFYNCKSDKTIAISDTHFLLREPTTGCPIGHATISRDITEQKQLEFGQKFLADIGAVLSESLDAETTLCNIARASIRDFTDFCFLFLVEDPPSLKRLAAECKDPAHVEVCRKLMQIPLRLESSPISIVLKTKRPLLLEALTRDLVEIYARNDEHLRMILDLNIKSSLLTPVLLQDKVYGVLAFLSKTRTYDQRDLNLAEEISKRASLSIANAHLFKETQRAVQTREDVLAIVSHDLKNPLAAINLAAQSLVDSADNSSRRALGSTIRESVKQMQYLIGHLLDFAKIQSGTFSIERKPESLREILTSIVEIFRGLAKEKNIQVYAEFAHIDPLVECDKHMVSQVVSNIMGNALKFTPSGGRISLATRTVGDEIEVSISDTGPGISCEELPKVFDRYWQSQKTKKLGTGLGLAIARGIIEAHKGRIWVTSQLGQGATFYFTLPRLKNAVSEPLQNSQSQLSGMRILLVDDSTEMLILTKHILEKAGAVVIEATSVAEAYAKFNEAKPDVMITDIEMPDGTGYMLVEKLRDLLWSGNHKIPVAAFTAHDLPQDAPRMKAAGFDMTISKVLDVKSIVASVRALGAKRKSMSPATNDMHQKH